MPLSHCAVFTPCRAHMPSCQCAIFTPCRVLTPSSLLRHLYTMQCPYTIVPTAPSLHHAESICHRPHSGIIISCRFPMPSSPVRHLYTM
jgi:hypothetical protein